MSKNGKQAQRESQRHAEADDIGDQLGKVISRCIEHSHGRHRSSEDRQNSGRNCQPEQEGVAEPPNDTGARIGAAASEETAEERSIDGSGGRPGKQAYMATSHATESTEGTDYCGSYGSSKA
jgi:hypothetical protein